MLAGALSGDPLNTNMGNCMETFYTPRSLDMGPESMAEAAAAEYKTSAYYDADNDNCGLEKGESEGKGGVKLKIVLTKAELEWLMLLLSEEKGGGVEGMALELALEKIQQGRNRDGTGEKPAGRSWRPSLECIMECPETQSFEEDHLGR